MVLAQSWMTKAILSTAVSIVRDAAERTADNPERRAWAVKELQAHGLSENMARLAVEVAVARMKRAQVTP